MDQDKNTRKSKTINIDNHDLSEKVSVTHADPSRGHEQVGRGQGWPNPGGQTGEVVLADASIHNWDTL